MDRGSPVVLSNCNLPLNRMQGKPMKLQIKSTAEPCLQQSAEVLKRGTGIVKWAYHVSACVPNKAVTRDSCNLDFYNPLFHQALGLFLNLKHLYTSPTCIYTAPQPLYCWQYPSRINVFKGGSFRLRKVHTKRDSLENIFLPGFLPFLMSQILIKYYKILVFLSGNPTPLLHTRNLGIVQFV